MTCVWPAKARKYQPMTMTSIWQTNGQTTYKYVCMSSVLVGLLRHQNMAKPAFLVQLFPLAYMFFYTLV